MRSINSLGRLALIGVVLAIVMGLVAGCTELPPVQMKHPQTGNVVTCDSYTTTRAAESRMVAHLHQRGCIEDFQRQGYQRVP